MRPQLGGAAAAVGRRCCRCGCHGPAEAAGGRGRRLPLARRLAPNQPRALPGSPCSLPCLRSKPEPGNLSIVRFEWDAAKSQVKVFFTPAHLESAPRCWPLCAVCMRPRSAVPSRSPPRRCRHLRPRLHPAPPPLPCPEGEAFKAKATPVYPGDEVYVRQRRLAEDPAGVPIPGLDAIEAEGPAKRGPDGTKYLAFPVHKWLFDVVYS